MCLAIGHNQVKLHFLESVTWSTCIGMHMCLTRIYKILSFDPRMMLANPQTIAIGTTDLRHLPTLGLLEPIIKCGVSSTPPDDKFYVIEETVHFRDISLDLATIPQDTSASAASGRHTFHTFFRKRLNDRN